MSETFPNPQKTLELSPVPPPIDAEQYIQDVLQPTEVIDNNNVTRSKYHINGRNVVFRTRQEAPLYEGVDVTVPGGELVLPIESETLAKKEVEVMGTATDTIAITNYVKDAQVDNKENILVVTNTPEGLLAAANILTTEPELRSQQAALLDNKENTDHENGQFLAVTDVILAAISIDKSGQLLEQVDVNGWATALAALSGDSQAKQIVDQKLEALYADERHRHATRIQQGHTDIDEGDASLLRQNEIQRDAGLRELESYEPVPLSELALIHSTSYGVTKDSEGTVVLQTAGDLRDDKLPRASLHFTLNSRVYPHAQAQDSWGQNDIMIVANAKKTIDASKRLPHKLDGIDTWFTLNPDEQLKLPDAVIVEPAQDLRDGLLFELSESNIRFSLKESYSEEEKTTIMNEAAKYNVAGSGELAETVKEIALRKAMEQVGIPINLMDSPSQNGHGMTSDKLARRIYRTASQLGLPSGKHFETPEYLMERDAYNSFPGLSGKIDSFWSMSEQMSAYPNAAIEARRRALASGYYAARPVSLTDKAKTALTKSEAMDQLFF